MTAANDSADDNAGLLLAMYEAESDYLAAGGAPAASFDILAPYFSPDVVLHQAATLPYGGTWRGHRGIEQFFQTMSRTWQEFDMVDRRLLSTGQTAVVLTHVHARSRTTRETLDFPILQTLEILDGRIRRVDPFYWDTAAIAAVCGHPITASGTGVDPA